MKYRSNCTEARFSTFLYPTFVLFKSMGSEEQRYIVARRVAIIGAGSAGIVAAKCLQHRSDIACHRTNIYV